MIRTQDVRVDYKDVTAVQDLTMHVAGGEVFGLIGPNGAGKTSTIRVLATLQTPTYGEVFINGIDVASDPASARAVLGYMPDMPPVYDGLKCWEFLDLFASAYSVPRRERHKRIDECIEQVNLSSKRNAKAGTLSRGMKQRLVLAKTILPDPQVLLLDEPASGLDPIARIDLRDALKAQAALGKAILVSSHILTELSEFCTSIGIMEKGRMVVSGAIDDIVTDMAPNRRIVLRCLGDHAPVLDVLEEHDGVGEVSHKDGALEFDFDGDEAQVSALLAMLVGRGVAITGFYEKRIGVEDIMLSVGAREVS